MKNEGIVELARSYGAVTQHDFEVISMTISDDFKDSRVRQQYLDNLNLLAECKDLISEAQMRGLSLLHSRETGKRINKLLAREIIDPHSPGSLMLGKGFLSILSMVALGRNFGDFSQHDFERVALEIACVDVRAQRA